MKTAVVFAVIVLLVSMIGVAIAGDVAYPDLDDRDTHGFFRCRACRLMYETLIKRLAEHYPEDEGQAGHLLTTMCNDIEHHYGLKISEDGTKCLPEWALDGPGVLRDHWVREHWHALCKGHLQHIDVQMIMTKVDLDPVGECPCPGDNLYFHHDPFQEGEL